jgi:hypothetical protein
MSPPLVMDTEVAAKCMDIIEEAIGVAEKKFGYTGSPQEVATA